MTKPYTKPVVMNVSNGINSLDIIVDVMGNMIVSDAKRPKVEGFSMAIVGVQSIGAPAFDELTGEYYIEDSLDCWVFEAITTVEFREELRKELQAILQYELDGHLTIKHSI